MNQRNHSEERQLTLATDDAAPEAALDAQAQQLREGWSALDHALRQQDAGFDAEAFAKNVSAELTALQPMARADRSVAIAWRLVAGAIAASLLVAVTWWLAQPVPGPGDVAKMVSQKPIVAHTAAESVETSITWDDPLDLRISQFQEQMSRFGAAGRLDASLLSLDQRMAELASDLEAGSL